ncbi:MAG: carbohydrate kinase family protein, partial [Promethearchaeia archaeon]
MCALPASLQEDDEDAITAAMKSLQARGARNVLVTFGAAGSLLMLQDGTILRQSCCSVPGGKTLDATAAGDSYRAAFVCALVEGRDLEECMQRGSAAGAICVSRMGAMPSLPFRDEVERLRRDSFGNAASGTAPLATLSQPSTTSAVTAASAGLGGMAQGTVGLDGTVTSLESMKFGSRLNSMKDRLDLWDGANDVYGWIARQGTIKGLDLIDF